MSKKPKRRNHVPRISKNSNLLLDRLNIQIIKDLIGNPHLRSSVIASKYSSPLSTVQRRRASIERTILKKAYLIDVMKLGWRKSDLMICVDKGNCEEVAQKLLERSDYVISVSLRIGDPAINIMAEVYYNTSQDLHYLIESIRTIRSVTSVEWSEVVKVIGSNSVAIVDTVLANGAND